MKPLFPPALLIFSVLLLALPICAYGAEEAGEDRALEIMKKHTASMAAKHIQYEIRLTIINAGGSRQEATIVGISLTRDDGQRKMMFVFTSPEEVRDAEFLFVQDPNRENAVEYSLSPEEAEITTLTGTGTRPMQM